MSEVLLRVTYRVRVHEMEHFETILMGEVVPLALELGIDFRGVWKSLVGRVGEYMELWAFESLADFEARWPKLLGHPRIVEIFKVTGPLVEDEVFSLIEPVRLSE